jgi:Ras-related protein Rab-23
VHALEEKMQISSFETEIKVIIVGNGRVGKTSLITRFVEDTFTLKYVKTIGVDFLEKRMLVPSIHEMVTFYLYDTAGQEEYNALTRSFYKGAGAAIVAFSSVDRRSFEAVPNWIRTVREECGQIPLALVQTKLDLVAEATVDTSEAESLALDENLELFRICSKDNVRVNPVFEKLCFDYVRRRRLLGGQLESPVRRVADLQNIDKRSTAPQANPQVKRRAKASSSLFTNCTIM